MIFSGGGGNNPLNFKVVGGTTAPANPKENAIWVNTDTEITAYSFSTDQPTSGIPGMVWCTMALSGSAGLNVLKKNTIQIFLASAYQYIGGAWVKKEFQVYSNGKWNSGRIVFHDSSADLTISGGYGMTAMDGSNVSYIRVESDGSLRSYTRSGGDVWWFSNNAVDLTPYSTISFTFFGRSTTGAYAHTCALGIAKNRGTSFASQVLTYESGTVTLTMDVSALTGKYYIGGHNATLSGSDNTYYVYEIIIE